MKYFENAEMEVISFATADVITTSGEAPDSWDGEIDTANEVGTQIVGVGD